MIGGIFAHIQARKAQVAQRDYARRLAEYHREQAEYHAATIRRSRRGPIAYKCGPWRWTITPIPGTVLRHVKS